MIENIATGITDQNSKNALKYPYLYQDVFSLIDLFERAYQHSELKSVLALEGFFMAVNQFIADMAFRCLHDFRTRRCFKQCRAVVNDYLQNKTPEQPERLIGFFSAIAHLVQYGVKSLRDSKYPEEYTHFLEHLGLALNPKGMSVAHQTKVSLLLQELYHHQH